MTQALSAGLASWLDRHTAARRLDAFGAPRADIVRGAMRLTRAGIEVTYEFASSEHRFAAVTLDRDASPASVASVWVSPDDPRLDASALDSAEVARAAAQFAGLPVAASASVERCMIAHRFGRRMVQGLTLRTPDDGAHVVAAKTRHRAPRAGVELAPSAHSLAAIPRSKTLGRVGTGHVVLFEWIAASSLHDALRSGAPAPLARVGQALADFHARARLTGASTVRTSESETAPLRSLATLAEDACGIDAAPILEGIAELERSSGAAAFDGAPHVVVHGDLHDKQVFPREDTVVLIDLDGAALAPAALDVGNFAAHLVLRAVQSGRDPRDAAGDIAAFVSGYTAQAGACSEGALLFAYRASAVRLALLYLLRIDGAAAFDPLMREALEPLVG